MPSEPTVLAFDTSAAHCAAALLCGGKIVAQRYEEMAKGQGERLIPLLNRVLDDHGAVWAELTGIAVGVGPGNFTGIRVSVAAARGLALSLRVPAIGVSVFEAVHHHMAQSGEVRHLVSLPQRDGFYLQRMLHGRHNGAAFAMSRTNPDRPPVPLDEPDDTVVLGDHAADIARMIELARGRPTARRDCAPPWPRMAEFIAQIAATRLDEPVSRPAPLYIRAPDAAPPRDAPPVIVP